MIFYKQRNFTKWWQWLIFSFRYHLPSFWYQTPLPPKMPFQSQLLISQWDLPALLSKQSRSAGVSAVSINSLCCQGEPVQRKEIATLLFYDLDAVAEGFKAASPIWEAGALGSHLFILIKRAPCVPQPLEASECVLRVADPTPSCLVSDPRSWRLGTRAWLRGSGSQ